LAVGRRSSVDRLGDLVAGQLYVMGFGDGDTGVNSLLKNAQRLKALTENAALAVCLKAYPDTNPQN